MAWSKRGNGKQYDSLNGYGAIIGFLSGKILDFGTRNRKCKACDYGIPKNKHDCRVNFHGTAKATEAALGSELVNRSSVLKHCGLQVRVIIGDEDASTIAAIRKYSLCQMLKLADLNHLKQNFNTDLYHLKLKFKELNRSEVCLHIRNCFSYAVASRDARRFGRYSFISSAPFVRKP